MIYPIVIYGSQVLRNKSENITAEYPELKKLLEDMWLTLYVDGEWVASRGHYENILDEIRKSIELIDNNCK